MKTVLAFTVRSLPWIACALLMGACDSKTAKQEEFEEASSANPSAQKTPSPVSQARAKPADTEPSCAAICEKSKSKGCAGEQSVCMARCRDMTLDPECRSELERALACFAGLLDTDFQCGDDGFPEVLQGRCDREQEAVVQCLAAVLK